MATLCCKSLIDAVCTRHLNCISSLIDGGKDVNFIDEICHFRIITPLQLASQHGQSDCVRLLIEKGADVNLKDRENWTPLHLASACGHLDCIQLLLDNGADKTLINDRGESAFDLAKNDEIRAFIDTYEEWLGIKVPDSE